MNTPWLTNPIYFSRVNSKRLQNYISNKIKRFTDTCTVGYPYVFTFLSNSVIIAACQSKYAMTIQKHTIFVELVTRYFLPSVFRWLYSAISVICVFVFAAFAVLCVGSGSGSRSRISIVSFVLFGLFFLYIIDIYHRGETMLSLFFFFHVFKVMYFERSLCSDRR